MSAVRILIADDHTLVRAGLRKLLEGMAGIEVVGEAQDGLQALAMAEQWSPHVVLMDIAMPKLNGLEAIAKILKVLPEVRIVILSMHQNEVYVRQALRHGAAGYLLKDAAPMELELALKAVLAGQSYLSPGVTQGVMNDYVHRLRGDEKADQALPQRQREVLKLIAEGFSTKEIARTLDISVKTVESHRTQLMRQLDIHEVAGLVRYAIREGIAST